MDAGAIGRIQEAGLCMGLLSRQMPFLCRRPGQLGFYTQLCAAAALDKRTCWCYDDGDGPGSPDSYLRQVKR